MDPLFDARAFDALGDATRRQVLQLLAAGEQPAGALVTALQARTSISQPAVSQHLRVLREAGLVTVRADGSRRLYAIDPRGVEAARAWLAALTEADAMFAALEQPLDALATEVARGRKRRSRTATAPSTDARVGRSDGATRSDGQVA